MNLTHLCHFFPHCNNSSANTRVRSKLENRDRLKSMSTATFVGKVRHIAKKLRAPNMDMVLKHHAIQDCWNGEKWGEKWQNRRAESRDEDLGSDNYRCPPGSDNHIASPSASAASFFHDIASPSASAASIFHDVASPSASAALKISRCRRCSRFRCLALPHHCSKLTPSNLLPVQVPRFQKALPAASKAPFEAFSPL